MKKIFLIITLSIFCLSLVSAGIGIKYSKESAMVNEGEEACLTYSVYNPWPDDSYAQISLSGDISEILIMQEAEAKHIPAETSSQNAIPVEFCFKVPKIYERDYAWTIPGINAKVIDKLDCSEDMKVYEGEVVAKTVSGDSAIGGTGGSTTQMSVGAPLRVRVRCNPYDWNYMPVYITLALFSGIVVFWVLFSKYRKPKKQRIKEKMQKLKSEMGKSKKK